MDPTTIVLIGLALAFGFYMAWNIGANDVANAMGTSVGSGALTLKRAVILAAIFEFAGAFLVGPHVSDTIRNGIISPAVFQDQPMQLGLGMIAALLAAGAWLQLASYFGWPVSTTHSIVGAVIGFGVVVGGASEVNWIGESGVLSIVASWVISPALSSIVAFIVFRFILRQIFYKPDPLAAAKWWTPIMVFCVLVTMLLVVAFKGMTPFWARYGLKPFDTLPLTLGLSVALTSGIVGSLVSRRLVVKIGPTEETELLMSDRDLFVARSLRKAVMHLRRVRSVANNDIRRKADELLQATQALQREAQERAEVAEQMQPTTSSFGQVERIFVYLQIISACFVAFAHGANDVANAVGPLSAAIEIVQTHAIPKQASIHPGLLVLGGIGIVVGLATWGWRVMETIGKRITELTPSRGFCAEFAAALTILLASVYKMPISATHTLVGAVLGVGMARGLSALNLNTLRDISVSWIITIPAGAGLAIVFFYLLQAIFL